MAVSDLNKTIIQGMQAQISVDGCYLIQPMKLINMTLYSQYLACGYDPLFAALIGGITLPNGGGTTPHVGEEHPYWPGFVMESIDSAPVDRASDQVRFFARYRNIKYVQIRITSNIFRDSTVLDCDGKLLAIYYSDDESLGPQWKTTSNKQGQSTYAECPIYRPTMTLEFDYITKINPLSRDVPTVLGCVNKSPWQGQPRYTWLCADDSSQAVFDPISGGGFGQGIDGKVAFWRKHMAFHWRGLKAVGRNYHEDWRDVLVWRDPHNPRFIPPNLDPGAGLEQGEDEGNGWIRVLLYRTADFGAIPDIPQSVPNLPTL